ncbi:exodeoxyribonuclease VII large subunit [Craterilacuibacter sp.]|uniref:exodeoxyribonuclease VII large subunit n=1 Tax=Craterilacuibacter sp. TaxID=2870909 RepID=UPI003F3F605A
MLFTTQAQDVISVTALNRMARTLLENGIPSLWIGGEISNLTLAASGHAYFSLKDAGAQIRCVMFRQRVNQLDFKPREGMQVELRGAVTLYEARGDYQISVETMREAGLGKLYEAYEKLKKRLAIEGLFAEEHKQRLPLHPRAIGIVTSPAAAALRDVITTLARRMPDIPVILYPTPVQGKDAALQIAQAITRAGKRNEVDVIIVCRGGGSIEDLWAFNEEPVARAIAHCPIPIVSGIGHETDFTICDFVADQRAPTPTAAAELVSPSRDVMLQHLERGKRGLERALARLIIDKGQRLDYLANRLSHPGERLARQQQDLARARMTLEKLIKAKLKHDAWQLEHANARLARLRPDPGQQARALQQLATRLMRASGQMAASRRMTLLRIETTLSAMNPEAVLARGYAIVQNAQGKAVKSPSELSDGEQVRLQLAEGQVSAQITLPQGTQTYLPF